MKVAVLKDFAIAIDEYGVKTRPLVAGTVDEVPDDIAPSLVDEGYVSLKLDDAVLLADGVARPLGVMVEAEALVDDAKAGWSVKDVVQSAGGGVSQIAISDDWQKAHHKTRVALAKKISGVDGLTTEQADEIIADELLRRAGTAPSSGDE